MMFDKYNNHILVGGLIVGVIFTIIIIVIPKYRTPIIYALLLLSLLIVISTSIIKLIKIIKFKEFLKNFLVFLVTVIILIIVFEVGLRMFYPQKPTKIYNASEIERTREVELNSHFGWALKPNFTNTAIQRDTDKMVKITHNSKGLRLPYEVPYEKAENKKRMILLGDSFVYGTGLDDSETIAYQMQEMLGDNWDVIPLSAPGYGTDQEFLILQEEGLKYSPDIVILFFYQNDISDVTYYNNYFADKPLFNLINGTLFRANYPTHLRWIKNYNRTDPVKKSLLSDSYLYSLWINNKGKLLKRDYRSSYKDSELMSLEKEYTEEMKDAVTLVIFLFMKLNELGIENNYKYIVVNVPSKYNIYREYQDKIFKEYNVKRDDFEFDKISKIFLRELFKLDIDYIDLINFAKNNDLYFKSDGHWSPKGVELTSKLIAGILEEYNLTNSKQKPNTSQ